MKLNCEENAINCLILEELKTIKKIKVFSFMYKCTCIYNTLGYSTDIGTNVHVYTIQWATELILAYIISYMVCEGRIQQYMWSVKCPYLARRSPEPDTFFTDHIYSHILPSQTM